VELLANVKLCYALRHYRYMILDTAIHSLSCVDSHPEGIQKKRFPRGKCCLKRMPCSVIQPPDDNGRSLIRLANRGPRCHISHYDTADTPPHPPMYA
jgi:hypothetical protein